MAFDIKRIYLVGQRLDDDLHCHLGTLSLNAGWMPRSSTHILLETMM